MARGKVQGAWGKTVILPIQMFKTKIFLLINMDNENEKK